MPPGRVLGSGVVLHGGRATAGGRVPWWMWGLLVWSLVAVVLGVVLGRVLRAADRRERGQRRGADGARAVSGPVPPDVAPLLSRGQSVGPKTATHPPEVSSSSRPPQVEP